MKKEEEEEKKREGESLTDYITRLETLQDSQRIRVRSDYTDEDSNVIVQPVVIYCTDADGTPHPLVDTSGHLSSIIDSSTLVAITGTYTAGAAATPGRISIAATGTDTVHFLRGLVTIGAAAAAPGDLEVYFVDTSVNTGRMARISPIAVDDQYTIPVIGAAVADLNVGEFSYLFARRLGGSMNIDISAMANTETFVFSGAFLSLSGTAPTVTATNGTWA